MNKYIGQIRTENIEKIDNFIFSESGASMYKGTIMTYADSITEAEKKMLLIMKSYGLIDSKNASLSGVINERDINEKYWSGINFVLRAKDLVYDKVFGATDFIIEIYKNPAFQDVVLIDIEEKPFLAGISLYIDFYDKQDNSEKRLCLGRGFTHSEVVFIKHRILDKIHSIENTKENRLNEAYRLILEDSIRVVEECVDKINLEYEEKYERDLEKDVEEFINVVFSAIEEEVKGDRSA